MLWRDIITMVARHGQTPITMVEEWEVDQVLAYHASILRVIKMETPKSRNRDA